LCVYFLVDAVQSSSVHWPLHTDMAAICYNDNDDDNDNA